MQAFVPGTLFAHPDGSPSGFVVGMRVRACRDVTDDGDSPDPTAVAFGDPGFVVAHEGTLGTIDQIALDGAPGVAWDNGYPTLVDPHEIEVWCEVNPVLEPLGR